MRFRAWVLRHEKAVYGKVEFIGTEEYITMSEDALSQIRLNDPEMFTAITQSKSRLYFLWERQTVYISFSQTYAIGKEFIAGGRDAICLLVLMTYYADLYIMKVPIETLSDPRLKTAIRDAGRDTAAWARVHKFGPELVETFEKWGA